MSSGREQRVAKRYARALFEVTPPAELDRAEAQLTALSRIWSSSVDFRQSLSNPRVSESARLAVVEGVVQAIGGWATEPVKKTVSALVSLRKGGVIPALAEVFALFVSEYKKSLRIEVTLAAAADENTITELQKKLSSALGGEVKMNVKTDATLLGGMTIRLGDSLLDRSVAGTLQRVASQIVR